MSSACIRHQIPAPCLLIQHCLMPYFLRSRIQEPGAATIHSSHYLPYPFHLYPILACGRSERILWHTFMILSPFIIKETFNSFPTHAVTPTFTRLLQCTRKA